jgi:hypothetical protein
VITHGVPDDIHRVLKSRAALAGMSLSDYLLREVRNIAERPTMEEMRARLVKPPAMAARFRQYAPCPASARHGGHTGHPALCGHPPVGRRSRSAGAGQARRLPCPEVSARRRFAAMHLVLARQPHRHDAAYVAPAELLDAPLITCDRRLAAAPGHTATIHLV